MSNTTTTTEWADRLAAGLDLTNEEDRAILRLRVIRHTDNMAFWAMAELATELGAVDSGLGIDEMTYTRYGVARLIAHRIIQNNRPVSVGVVFAEGTVVEVTEPGRQRVRIQLHRDAVSNERGYILVAGWKVSISGGWRTQRFASRHVRVEMVSEVQR